MEKASNPRIRSMDMPIIDKVFNMEGGYVLSFSNRTFADFFHEELGVDIYDPRWAVQGKSKANRLRYYLHQADRQTALTTLETLWEYRETSSVAQDYPELDNAVRAAFFSIIKRLGGTPSGVATNSTVCPASQIDEALVSSLADDLIRLSTMPPQPRGYAFEQFLKRLFDAYEMAPRAPFRLVVYVVQLMPEFIRDIRTESYGSSCPSSNPGPQGSACGGTPGSGVATNSTRISRSMRTGRWAGFASQIDDMSHLDASGCSPPLVYPHLLHACSV